MPQVSFPGTIKLDFEWDEGSPAAINYKLMKIANVFENPLPITAEAKAILRIDMRERFEQEVTPQGDPWEPIKQPEEQQIGILRRGSTDAAMYRAATSDRAWSSNSVGVFLDTSGFPPYWPRHEQPSGNEGGGRIPRREFIGSSNEAQLEIENFAFYWLNEEVYEIITEPAPVGVFSPRTGKSLGVMGQTSIIGGVARREIRDPSTGQFVSTRPEFYS